jgi:hypothetical protein
MVGVISSIYCGRVALDELDRQAGALDNRFLAGTFGSAIKRSCQFITMLYMFHIFKTPAMKAGTFLCQIVDEPKREGRLAVLDGMLRCRRLPSWLKNQGRGQEVGYPKIIAKTGRHKAQRVILMEKPKLL